MKEKIKNKQSMMGLASACVAVMLAVVLIIGFAARNQPAIDAGNVNSAPTEEGEDIGAGGEVQPPVEENVGMGFPVQITSVLNDFGFFYNQTINCYYHHDGVDFSADEGAEVFAAEDGTVESIYSGDILKGTEIVLNHGNGLKTTYRYVTAVEGLSVGDTVKQGDKIATVSEATGNEYKDGAHLHFEITENGKLVDPSTHLTFEEK